ncbi:MAG: hypothetical protein EON61_22160 [Alphaproteobacteria bacterium]|nr:MAG: hypothetical protein EON61_22160 [Alphaproteobacteria bacterium]
MRIVIFIVIALIAVVAGGVALFPMSTAADMAKQRLPDLKFANASGSVWDGKLGGLAYGEQTIGDVAVKTDLFSLFSGKVAGKVGMAREGLAGEADISYGLTNGGVDLKNLKLAGDTSMVPGMPPTIAAAGGKFTLNVGSVKFANGLCEDASGEVWTDALTKVNYKGWVGPELRGPVTCAGGKMQAQASGTAETGEAVEAALDIGQHLDMLLTATVRNAGTTAIEALTSVGFVLEGDKLVLRQAMASH